MDCMNLDDYRLAVHDAICANGKKKCGDRLGHARRILSNKETNMLKANLEEIRDKDEVL